MNSKKMIPIIVFFICSITLIVNISLTVMSMGIIVNDPIIEVLDTHSYLIFLYLCVYLILAIISVVALCVYVYDDVLDWKLSDIISHTAGISDRTRKILEILEKE